MRYIDTSKLPRWENGNINWNKCIGMISNFEFDNISGQIKYLKYDSKKQKITICIENYTDKNGVAIPTNYILNCCLTKIIYKTYIFKYDVNDIVYDNLIIKNKYYLNGYRYYDYQCLIDGYVGKIRESHLKDSVGCPVCKNKKVVVGVNDMWTTNPSLANLLYNKDDGYKYTKTSSKMVDWICPYCGNTIRQQKIANVSCNGLSCNLCSDGIHYPNKFMSNILSQFNIQYHTEYSPDWIKPRRYDFYIPSMEIIIEMDGGFHYKKQNNKLIDEEKDKIAKEHGIKVIRIDCNYDKLENRYEYIKNNVKIALKTYFNLDLINFDLANEYALKSFFKQIIEMYKNNYSCENIAKNLHLNIETVKRYLTIGTKQGLCHFTRNVKKPIFCKTTNHYFSSITLCDKVSEKVFGTHLTSKNMSRQIKRNRPHKGFLFSYITPEKFNKMKKKCPELCFGDFFI